MSGPGEEATVLQVQCGSCLKVVNGERGGGGAESTRRARAASARLRRPRLTSHPPAAAAAVPASYLETLLQQKTYNCPNCKSRQAINLDASQERALRFQAQQMLANQRTAMAAAQQAATAARASAAAGTAQVRMHVCALGGPRSCRMSARVPTHAPLCTRRARSLSTSAS